MSDLLAEVARLLADDEHIGVDAVWISREGGLPLAVRVVPSAPEGSVPGAGPVGMTASAVTVILAATALPGKPEVGDLLAFGGASYKVATARQDERGTSYTLGLRRS